MTGRIEIIIGPMFAGKTTELMRRVKREIHARRNCFVIKYSKDTRYDIDNVASHDKMTLKAKASVSCLKDVGDEWKNADVIAIDEGQFFPDLLEFCELTADSGKIVIISALDGDFQRKPFGKICELIPMAETVTKLKAVCMMCHSEEAPFTRRTVAGNQQELIGGADMYIATCRACYNNPQDPSPRKMKVVQEAISEVEKATMAAVTAQSAILSEPTSAIPAGEDVPAVKRGRRESPP